ncbi:MAG: SpoIIIAC/SpoIIIAD family protein [Hespellia sp.]|jgi:stage III sporulation protein AD|nr:SpoIIIAC/SpoIIIAD family protein [Hespellia sp.]
MNTSQIAVLSILGVLLAVQFKSEKPEYGIYISVVLCILIFYCVLNRLKIYAQILESFRSYVSVDNVYLNTMLKMIGITYIAEFASGICKDTGYQTVASQIDIFAKLSILALSIPVMLALLQTIQVFLS